MHGETMKCKAYVPVFFLITN